MAKKCKHSITLNVWSKDSDEVIGGRCSSVFGCGDYISLGPSNDKPEAVRIEIRAAELAIGWKENPGIIGPLIANTREGWGWEDHEKESDDDVANHAGWLAREITMYDRDRDAWPWDPTRPVAGQYEEWLEKQSADDRPIRYGAPEAIGMTPRQLRETTAAATAEEDALRDPEVTARNAEVLAARQAAQDGYTGPAAVVELVVGEEPDGGGL
ncbi:MAG TPA: hypothetical protein VFT22_07585 [Kofleriaceae bacterium]|nr:hypothetical protein [Kofleriaceae bacterium]